VTIGQTPEGRSPGFKLARKWLGRVLVGVGCQERVKAGAMRLRIGEAGACRVVGGEPTATDRRHSAAPIAGDPRAVPGGVSGFWGEPLTDGLIVRDRRRWWIDGT